MLIYRWFEERWNLAARSAKFLNEHGRIWGQEYRNDAASEEEFAERVNWRFEDVQKDFRKLHKQWKKYTKHASDVRSTIDTYIEKLNQIKAIDDARNKDEIDAWLEDEEEVFDELVREPGPKIYKQIDQKLALATGKMTVADLFREAGLIETGVIPNGPGRQLRIFETPQRNP